MKYRNSHGIEIKKCCASCRFKDLTRLMTARFCTQHHKSVKPKGCCKQWAISEQLEAAGRGGGQVKRRAYLRYLLEVRADERLRVGERSSGMRLADQLGIHAPHKSIDQIRQEFEKNHGSIFLSL